MTERTDISRAMRIMSRTMLILTPAAFIGIYAAAAAQGASVGSSLLHASIFALCCLVGAALFHLRQGKSARDLLGMTVLLRLVMRN